MSIPALALKIAAELIEQQLQEQQQQQQEPADQPQTTERGNETAVQPGYSALRLLGRHNRPTATEPAPKIVSTTGGRDL